MHVYSERLDRIIIIAIHADVYHIIYTTSYHVIPSGDPILWLQYLQEYTWTHLVQLSVVMTYSDNRPPLFSLSHLYGCRLLGCNNTAYIHFLCAVTRTMVYCVRPRSTTLDVLLHSNFISHHIYMYIGWWIPTFQIKIRIQPLHLDKNAKSQVYVKMHVLRLLQLYYLLHPHLLPLPLISVLLLYLNHAASSVSSI